MTDWQLIEAYRTGDEQAFATLVQKYYSLVYGAACRHVCDAHLAQDVTQCVFLLFARKAKGLSPATAIGGWFLRTVRFVARDVAKKRRHWQQVEYVDTEIETIVHPAFDPTGPLASLEEAILALSAKEQTCLLAKYYEGKSLREIGTDLNISKDAAEKRVARALEKMRDFFQRRGFKISVATIPVLLTAGFPVAAKGMFAETAAVIGAAAVKGKAFSSGAAALTAKATKVLAWKQWLAVGTKVAVVLFLTGTGAGWVWLNRQPPIPPRAAFDVQDPLIATLGKTWSQAMERAAIVRRRFPQTPRPEDPRVPALREENKSLFHDRMDLSFGLRKLDAEASARAFLPAYLTCGLSELLDLSASQRAFVFDLTQQFLPEGIREEKGSEILESSKPAIAAAVRDTLSILQRRRFDEVCGSDGQFLLINRTSYGRVAGNMAWQDWLGGGGIITPEEAMQTVPPDLW